MVKSTKDHTVLPHNANLGSIQPFNSNHEQVFSEAADHTAHTLADTWFEYAKHTGMTQNPSSVARSQAQPTGTSCFPQSWSLQAQTSEMTKAGLDSSYLSPFLPEPDLDPPHVHPPVEDVSLDPHSEEYFQQLVAALDLETDTYAHVDLAIMSKFKALIRKYSHAFYLPGSELTPITGFHHNIDTGDSPPVYRLPYRKSPSELAAIKDELQKMLKLHIIRPSFSSWGAPCILVRKPLEKGLPQPPRFVVDYRGLNTVTAGDGYPIPSVSNVLDALSGGKKFAKLDLASGYWQVLVNPAHMHKTAFATHLGLYEFLRMPYGLKTVHLAKSDQTWVKSTAPRCKIIDDLILYSDVLMDDPSHLRIFVPSDIELQRHLLQAYHDSPIGMHRGRDATYNSLSHDFYWRHMHKHVRNWVRRCPQCIRFKSLKPSHGPMQLRLYQYPFHTLGVDYVGELPASPLGNKWILTVVCPYSNYLRAIPVPDKTATTAANVLFHEVFLQLGFPSVLQSDRGGEFLNALLHRITQFLSIKQVFTSGFRPGLNGATERSHRFLNSALGIFCEHQQEKWEQFLQPAVYSHNVSPISGTTNITPFFLVFGRDAPSPETISFDLPVNPLPPDHYARHLLSRMKVAHQQFSQVKSDLRRHQKEVYDCKARFLAIPPGKIVYVRKEPQTHKPGMATRFLRSFDGPFQVIGHPYDRNDLLTLKNLSTGAVIPRPVNIEKCVVIPEQETFDLQPSNDSVVESEPEAESPAPLPTASHVNPELCQVAYEFGKYLASLSNKTATASQACKQVYLSYPSAREILTRHGKLRGLIKACPYLQMDGEAHGGLYLSSLNQEAFRKLFPSL